MANNAASVTDPEAVTNVTTVDKEISAAPSVDIKPSDKTDLTAVQVDKNPDADVSLDDFLAVKDGIEKASKPVDVKVDDKKIADDNKNNVVAKPDAKVADVKVDDKKVSDVKVDDKKENVDGDKRTYDDLPEALRPIFKKAHNETYNTFKPIIKQYATDLDAERAKSKELETKYQEVKKGALPDNYYEHQRGYVLSPEFETAANNAIRAEQVANHWKTQLEAIRKGEPTYQDLIVNQRTGELSLSKPIQVDKTAESEVAGYVDWAQNQLMERQFSVRSVAEKHASTHQSAVSQVQDFEKAAFKVFSEGEAAKAWEPIIKDTVMKTFPPAFRNNPLASGYAKALITISKLGEQLMELKKNGGKAAEVVKTDDGKVVSADDKKKAGPSGSDMANAGAGAKASDEEVTFDDFKAVKNQTAYIRK